MTSTFAQGHGVWMVVILLVENLAEFDGLLVLLSDGLKAALEVEAGTFTSTTCNCPLDDEEEFVESGVDDLDSMLPLLESRENKTRNCTTPIDLIVI